MKPTHRTNDLRVVDRDGERTDRGTRVIVIDGQEWQLDGGLFDVLFRELPSADGVIVYSCGCPYKDDIEVRREWIITTIDEGLTLKQSGNRFLPNVPDNFDALASAAEQMVKEGIIQRSPFY